MHTRTPKTVTIRIPQFNVLTLLFDLASQASSRLSKLKSLFSRRSLPGPNSSRRFNFKKSFPVLLVLFSAAATMFVFAKLLGKTNTIDSAQASRITVAGAKSQALINRDFIFPVKDAKGKKVTDIKFFLENVELRDEIIVQGKRATAIEGRSFMILTFKITTDYTRGLEINSRDYFRLVVNGVESDLLAPDIHNDPVIVQPVSTKYTRVGWPVYDTDSSHSLFVGEIEGEKTKVELN